MGKGRNQAAETMNMELTLSKLEVEHLLSAIGAATQKERYAVIQLQAEGAGTVGLTSALKARNSYILELEKLRGTADDSRTHLSVGKNSETVLLFRAFGLGANRFRLMVPATAGLARIPLRYLFDT
jgi:hypothetical protein